MISIFTEKNTIPTDTDLKRVLGKTYKLWKDIENLTLNAYPAAHCEWNYSGAKYGWSYRIKDKKRAILYLQPRDNFFKVAFVFGEKAVKTVMESTITESIKAELQNARPYAEGRGIRIEIRDSNLLKDIEKLITIKLNQ